MTKQMKNQADNNEKKTMIPYQNVERRIVTIRQMPVIADADVADLYGVETKRINEAVRNNPDKFPEEYMFILSNNELGILRSKISSTKVSTKKTATRQKPLPRKDYTCWRLSNA